MAMPLAEKMLVCAGIAVFVWIAFTMVPAAIRVYAGRATGIALTPPRFLQWLPRTLRIPAMLLGIPLVIGSLIGLFWHLLWHE